MALTPAEIKLKKIASLEKKIAKNVEMIGKYTVKSDAKSAARIALMTALSVEIDNTKKIKLQVKIDKAGEMIQKYQTAIVNRTYKNNLLAEEVRILKL